MKILKNNLFLLSLSVFLVFLVFLIVVFISIGKSSKTTITGNFNTNYSKINTISPGKDTVKDVENNNGLPLSKSGSGNLITYYYQTPNNDYKNIVVFKNGVVYYSLEYVFNNYRGTLDSYSKKYGSPELHLYTQDNLFREWFVFLAKVVAVENGQSGISRILYFTPMTKENFIAVFSKEINAATTPFNPPPEDIIVP